MHTLSQFVSKETVAQTTKHYFYAVTTLILTIPIPTDPSLPKVDTEILKGQGSYMLLV